MIFYLHFCKLEVKRALQGLIAGHSALNIEVQTRGQQFTSSKGHSTEIAVGTGVQDSSNWRVPGCGFFHDQGQEELSPPQPSRHGLCLPLQAGMFSTPLSCHVLTSLVIP